MNLSLLDFLRCPYCGTRFEIVENDALERVDDRIESGVLGCQCCAFPVVAGIPVLIANERTRGAVHVLEAGRREGALFLLLDVEGARADALRALAARGGAATYRDALGILCRDAEGTCFLYRFSDPTYLVAEAMLTVLGRPLAQADAPFVDLCSGSGHVTRVLTRLAPRGGTIAVDLFFWKLWLATRFVAPECQAVCCDGNLPLPFARESCAMVVLADAFPYIWHKRLLAGEMVRLATPGGLIVMPHLHSSLGWNYSQGDTLTPAAYRDLFAPLEPRLFSDARLRDDLFDHCVVDLGSALSPEDLGDEPSFSLIAQVPGFRWQASGSDAVGSGLRASGEDLFRHYDVSDVAAQPRGELVINPLYRVECRDGRSVLTLQFPTPEYGAEFGDCRRYLPDTLTLDGDLAGRLAPQDLGSRYAELLRRRVVIDAPPGYC